MERYTAILRLVVALALFALAITYTNVITIIIGSLAIAWAWWKDAPITMEAQVGHANTKEMKSFRGHEWETAKEPEDSEVIE